MRSDLDPHNPHTNSLCNRFACIFYIQSRCRGVDRIHPILLKSGIIITGIGSVSVHLRVDLIIISGVGMC